MKSRKYFFKLYLIKGIPVQYIFIFLILTAVVLIVQDWLKLKVIDFNSIKINDTFFQRNIQINRLENPSREKGCLAEWSLLSNNIYFRRNLAFYYTDLNIIRLYFDRNKNYNHEISLSLLLSIEFSQLNSNTITSRTYSLENIKQVTVNEHAEHSFGYFESEILVDVLFAFDNINRAEVIVLNKKDSNRTSSINLIVKPYRVENNDEHAKNYSMLCSKIYRYISKEQMNDFKFWIEMNRLNGYEKLVIYNNSMEYNYEFNKMFNDYKDFVKIIQFKCLPNFLDANNSAKPFINSFNEIKDFYKRDLLAYTDHFETIVFNECYLINKNDYKYIAVNDQDELIIPRFFNLSHQNKMPDASKCYYSGLKSNETSNIQFYLDSHKKENNLLNKEITFHFNMGIYLKQQTVDIFFLQLEKALINSTSSDLKQFNVKDTNDTNSNNELVNFNVTINNPDEYFYAQYMLNMYLTVVKPFYAQNKLENVPENLNRFFFFLGPSTTWFCGKTIHNTLLTQSLSTHYPESFSDVEWMNIERGHVSHFRKIYNINWNDKSIMEFKIDMNYFLCYFKPIVKKLFS